MSVPAQTPSKEYIANGTTTAFPLEFNCDKAEYLIVTLNGEDAPVGSWTLANDTVTFNVAPLNGVVVNLERNTPFQRTTNYQLYDNSFRPSAVNKDFDLIWWKLQELGYRDQVIWLALVKEIADRIAGDDNLQNQINTIDEWLDNLQQNVNENTNDIAQLVTDLSKEIADRIQGDQILKDMFLSMIDEAINEGTINALAITHLDSLEALEGVTNVWDGRTIYVKGIGNYVYNALTSSWEVGGNSTEATLDQTGETQQQLNDASIHTVGSVAEMLALNEKFRPRTIRIKATGAMYIYDASQASINDGFYILNGWVLVGFHDRLLATLAGLKGDGSNEYTKLKALIDVSSSLNLPIDLCRLNISTSNLVASGHLKFIGTGGIKLFAGSNGTLLTSDYDIVIDGDIELDQNKASNSGGTVGSETHCTIKHTGDNLILKGAKIKPSASINVVTRAKKKVLSQDTDIDGGMITFYAISPTAKVEVLGGEYKNAHLYDNIQILNGGDVVVERVRSKDSKRSCIVIGNSTGKARIFGNYTSGAKTDGANQGGWGIVASVNSQDSVIGMNVCLNNQRGPMTVDTYPDSGPSVDNRISVFGNILGGKYNDAYATTGLGLNNVKHGNVTGNIIFSANQGILAVDSDHTLVHGNTIMDTVDFAFQGYLSPNITFKSNTVDGCTASGQAVIRFIDSTGFRCSGNTYRNLTGAASILYRVSGNTKDWIISEDDCLKLTAGSGYVFQILGAGVTGGKIRRNNYKADGVTGWQWYILSNNLAQFSTHDNEIESAGTSYISSGANVTAGDDTVNGSRNVWSAAPTAFKSRTGQVAAIAGVLKHWNGTTWA
ncbi:right-handed parallel beta-helix repeat-containing protein [Acinetobacter baumannii]|uniref:Right handed beta helix region family protein n=1 Tax=Acinetobacter baumannii 6014059 TaxID=525242 RepID=A0A828SRB6_ACIBA|nr:right-handed parallel beta-helix repeat-containing protein [Acinetobacter baumannii]EGJ67646.1 hypothetical protein HMPREF0022_02674 [Acinetobacter baumannii 6014059]EHU1546238.1 right-handed parallel beta-helix repeat-containing protein [Acinetobacter baumannii]EHU1548296.1 right-handed parallel beta-helix repeat-containing protein [Acinetobacter baumannii]EHU1972025.1 right-handed parallel beta-helix repeat-containing protein [Acinetobacter baumannii]EHU1974409.1 right-handed parallel bet